MNKTIKFKEHRTMDASTLRRVCIENNWYTNGTNEEYRIDCRRRKRSWKSTAASKAAAFTRSKTPNFRAVF